MIFTRVVVAVVVAVGLVAVLGAGGPDPGVALGAQRLIAERAAEADDALRALDEALGPPLQAARDGAARTAAGTEVPGPFLTDAGDALLSAEPLADRVGAAIRALDAARRAADPAMAPLGSPVGDGELGTLGAEISALAPSADGFAQLRMRAEGFGTLLADALDAIAASDPATARDLLARARADHEAIEAAELGLEALPVWIDTSADLLDAADALVQAVAEGDAAAAQAASDAIERIRPDAVFADRALRISMSEGAGVMLEGPPARVAELVRRVQATRDEVALILHAVGR